MNTYIQWLLLTVMFLIIYSVVGVFMDNPLSLTFPEAGFLSFVLLWCNKQDKKKGG